MTAADRGNGPLTSLSAHVTAGATEWTGTDLSDFAFEDAEQENEMQTVGSELNGTPPDCQLKGTRCASSSSKRHVCGPYGLLSWAVQQRGMSV